VARGPNGGAYQTLQHSNKNGGPIAGTAVCNNAIALRFTLRASAAKPPGPRGLRRGGAK